MVKTEHSNAELFRMEQDNSSNSDKFEDFENSVQDFRMHAINDDDYKNDEEVKKKACLNTSGSEKEVLSDGRNESAHSSYLSYANDSPILLSPGSENGRSSRDNNGGSSGTSGGGGGIDDKRIRRQIANCNERRRMQSINAGFQALRQLLPRKDGEKISKAAILQQTADFIHNLQLKTQIEMMDKKDRLNCQENEQMVKKRRLEKSEESLAKANIVHSTKPSMDILECLKTIEDLQNALTKEKQLRMIYEKELREMREKTFIELKNLTQQQSHHINGHMNNEMNSQNSNLIRTINNTIPSSFLSEQQQNSSNRTLFNKSCSPATLLEVVSVDNTSNIIKLHHLQQQEPEILPQTNLESSTMINQKFSNGVLMDSTTFKDSTSNTSTPVILTNFGAINSSNFQQQPTLQQQLQQNNNKPPSTLFLQINPNSHSSSFTAVSSPLLQTTLQPPQQAFQNLSVYCGRSEANSHQLQTQQQQLHLQAQQQQFSIQAKMVEELKYLTGNCNVITTASNRTTPATTNTLPNLVSTAETVPGYSTTASTDSIGNTNLSISQRNLQAILDAICHLEGSHAATAHAAVSAAAAAAANSTTSTSCSSNDLMVR